MFTRRCGTRGAPPLVLVHGFPTSSIDYFALAAELSSEFDIYLLDFPGYGFNSIGTYTGNQYAKITGQFAIGTALCAEPRVDPLLTVTYATADTRGRVTQYISGPYDLGRPRGCPKSASGGKTRIPSDDELQAKPKPKATKKTAKGKKKTAKK